MTRPLFGRDGALSKQQIYEMIDNSPPRRGLSQIRHQLPPRQRRHPQRPQSYGRSRKKPWRTSKRHLATASPLSPLSTMTTRCFAISTAFSLWKANSTKKNLRKSRGCGRSPQRRRGASDPGLTACTRACVSKNCSRLSKSTNANASRGGEGGCGTSGCNQPVNTAAMGVCPACPPTCLSVLSVNSGSRRATSNICKLEGGCTGNAHAVLQDFLAVGQLACSCAGYLPQTFPRPLRI